MPPPLMNDVPPIPPHQQEARTLAVIAIGHFLEGLGEPGWRSVILRWLAQYDGLEAYLYPEDDPILQVRDLLGRHVAALQPVEPARLADELANLPFCRYRAIRGNGDDTKWRPLEESFIAFSRGTTVEVWESEKPYPRTDVLRTWLLTQFCAAQLGRKP